MVTDDERREVAERLRELGKLAYSPDNTYELMADALGVDDFEGTDELFARLADLIGPGPAKCDATATCDVSQGRRDTVACDPTERGIDSIYEWCRERLEGADGAEDELYCAIMRAIEEYRHPERVTATTARPVDREALLALAEEMELSATRLRNLAGESASFGFLSRGLTEAEAEGFARRIREALGVAS